MMFSVLKKIEKQIKKELYMKIYEQFSTKIKQSAEYGHKQIFLRIPTYVMGYPASIDLRQHYT